jgi:hypothetical protein
MTRAKRQYLLALVEDRVCKTCNSAPTLEDFMRECGPCRVKRVDHEEMMRERDGRGWP